MQGKFCNGMMRVWAMPERFEKQTWTSPVVGENKSFGTRAMRQESREMNMWHSMAAACRRNGMEMPKMKTREIRRRELEAILERNVEL